MRLLLDTHIVLWELEGSRALSPTAQEAIELARQTSHVLAVAGLPTHHRDPFDRLLIAQARLEQLTIVTADSRIGSSGVPVIDAR